MTKALPALAVLQEIFARLFSNRWIARWQQAQLPPARSAEPRAAAGRKKTPRRPQFYQRLFSLRVTLWYLLYQRLNFDPTLPAVVTDLRKGGADRLGRHGRKLSTCVRSTNPGGYNLARQRLPLELLQAALAHVGDHLGKLVGYEPAPTGPPGPQARTRQLLDGSTLGMLATPALVPAYPPASNQRGASDWCLMRSVVGFCARRGAVFSAIEGALAPSEQALAWTLMERAAAFTGWIGDRNFGVWSVVAQARHCHQDVRVRLTRARARKLCAGRPLQSGEERSLQWKPSRHDQAAPGTGRKAVAGRLIYVRLQKAGRWIDRWLFTTLPATDDPIALLVAW